MTTLTSGCIAAPSRRCHAVETELAHADEPADDADMHDAAQRIAVALDRQQRQRQRRRKTVPGLGGGEPELRHDAGSAPLLGEQPTMRLSDPEASPGQPAESCPLVRHPFVYQRLRREGDRAARLVELCKIL